MSDLYGQDASQKELQRLWLTALKKKWSSLVVVPASPMSSAAEVGRAFSQVGAPGSGAMSVTSASGLTLGDSSKLILAMTKQAEAGGRIVVVLDSVLTNPACIPVALAADAAILCVQLGETETEDARRTLELIGREKFLGAVTLSQGR